MVGHPATDAIDIALTTTTPWTTFGGGGGNASTSHNVFALGGELYLPTLTGFMIGLVVFTIIFEFILHTTEHRLAKHPHHLKMLSKVYKELTILGFISMSHQSYTSLCPYILHDAACHIMGRFDSMSHRNGVWLPGRLDVERHGHQQTHNFQ